MRACHRRGGFSLIEVLLATAILMGAVVVLGQLTGIGYRNAMAARDEVTAQMLCEHKLNEIVSGLRPAETIAEAPIRDRPGWLSSVAVRPLEQPKLVSVEVAVRQDLPLEKRPVEYKLRRWLFQPMSPQSPLPQQDGTPSGGFSPGGSSPMPSPFVGSEALR